jgi:hypothetical protein
MLFAGLAGRKSILIELACWLPSELSRKEGKAMAEKILVPMKQNDRVEEFIPYIENVARAGMKVVFMMPYPVGGLTWPIEEFGRKAILEGKRLASYYTWDTNLQKARDRISETLKVLPAKGIEVAADLYAGSMRSAVEDYMTKGDVHLILARARMDNWIGRLLNSTVSVFHSLKRSSVSPVMLINPRLVV